MNMPEKVRIGSMDYDVIKTDNVILLDGVQCYGMIDYISHRIEIDETAQDEQGMEVTFLHELIHGILISRGMDKESADEKLVNELARGFHQVIRDNHNIFCCKKI